MKLRRWIKWTALVIAAGLGLLVFGFLPWWMGGLATTNRFQYRDRDNAGLTPASFKLPFEDVTFRAADGVTLKGWWVPAERAKGTVVLVHGLNRSRIEMVKKVPFLNGLGWNALLFDLRHHGESGGETTTMGDRERQDVHAARVLASERASGPIVYWGVSLGAAAATLAAADDPTVAGLVCDSTYRSLRDTVPHHLRLFRSFAWWLRVVPVWPVSGEVLYWMGRRGHFDPDAVDVIGAASRLSGRPCLFVCNSGDRRMPKEIAFELKAAVGPRAQVLVVPGESHGGAYRDGTEAYQGAVEGLLREVAVEPAPQRMAGR